MGRAFEVRKASMAKTSAQKAKTYSMYSKEIYIAAKNGEPDPDMNSNLKRWIDKAKKNQVPADIIKRAIDKAKSGTGEAYQALRYEGFGAGDSTVIVECLTDNINRVLSDIRPAFTKSKSKIGASGSVSYLYDHLAVLSFKGLDEEETLESLMAGEVDITDIETENGVTTVYGEPTDYYKIKTALEATLPNIEFEVDEIMMIPQSYCTLNDEELELFHRLINMLDAIDDVQNIFHNVANA